LVPNLPSGQDFETFLAARMAANESPDIMWQQFGTRNVRGSNWWTPLNDAFEQPNPYIEAGQPGSERWADNFQDYVLNQTRAADGNWYQASLDWVETGLYYNKEILAQAGVDPASWQSWGDFVADMTKVKETTDVDALGTYMRQQGWSNWWWADDIFLTVAWADMADEFYMEKYKDPNRTWRQLNPEEIAKAVLEGKLVATDPRMDDYLRMSKEFVSLLPADYAGIAALDDLDIPFFSGSLATVWTGTWKNKPYVEQIPFDYGVTYLPPFTTDDALGAQNTAYRVGGPSSCGQYGIAKSATDAGRFDLALDFLMFVAAPQNFEKLAVSHGGFIPMVKGAQAGEVMVNFTDIAALPERLFNDPDNRLHGPEHGDAWSQAMQAYFLDQTDLAATKEVLQNLWTDGATKLCAAQQYDWCPAQ
ncbi:MAG: carbohydrate ABC transporter substrate-binding protein, partial [Caldilineaceae bacterium]|nr:carbohydrate ABC transporter substrate-binding protein [Caldilineaceae bacterium]